MRRLISGLAASAMAMTLVIGLGSAARAAVPPYPECKGRDIPLQTGQTLVEHVAYFHGQSPLGNIDSEQEFAEVLTNGEATHRLVMDGTAPTGTSDKTFVSNIGDAWNTNYFMNAFLGYSYLAVTTPIRIVCAEATVYASTSSGKLAIQLWSDKALADPDPIATVTASGTANQASAYVANFGALDVTVEENGLVQFAGPDGNSQILYDSTTHPSKLTYVTVETA